MLPEGMEFNMVMSSLLTGEMNGEPRGQAQLGTAGAGVRVGAL